MKVKEIKNKISYLLKENSILPIFVRDVNEVESYPHYDGRDDIPEIKGSFAGFYNYGIMIRPNTSVNYLKESSVKGKFELCKELDVGSKKLLIIYKLPFDNIIDVNWDGDNYEIMPHFIAKFIGFNGSPFESYFYGEEVIGESDNKVYKCIVDKDDILEKNKD